MNSFNKVAVANCDSATRGSVIWGKCPRKRSGNSSFANLLRSRKSKLRPWNPLPRCVPQAQLTSDFPAVQRDLNLVVDERVRWAELAATVQKTAGEELERIEYRDTYRDPQRLGPGKKSQLFSITTARPSRYTY